MLRNEGSTLRGDTEGFYKKLASPCFWRRQVLHSVSFKPQLPYTTHPVLAAVLSAAVIPNPHTPKCHMYTHILPQHLSAPCPDLSPASALRDGIQSASLSRVAWDTNIWFTSMRSCQSWKQEEKGTCFTPTGDRFVYRPMFSFFFSLLKKAEFIGTTDEKAFMCPPTHTRTHTHTLYKKSRCHRYWIVALWIQSIFFTGF